MTETRFLPPESKEEMMPVKSSWLALPLLVAAASAIFAQQPVITPETPVNSTTLQQWLHSGDPRLIAWAADFARRTHDSELVQQMPALLEHWTIPPLDGADHSQAAQRRAVIAVLDTLIQENVQVPISGIQAVAEFFPAQAAILINRLPLTESRSTLDAWFAGVTGGWQARLLARIASMMLAKEPDPSFVATVVAGSEENLIVSVTSGGVGGFAGSGSSCCVAAGPNPPGWPEVYTYYLSEHPNDYSSLLIELDGDSIGYGRTKQNGGSESCSTSQIEALTPVTRHRLLAHWLGVRDKDMDWQPVNYASILWTDKAAYEQKLGALVEAEKKKLHATVEALRERGLLYQSLPTVKVSTRSGSDGVIFPSALP
jgi:hypothetical protein